MTTGGEVEIRDRKYKAPEAVVTAQHPAHHCVKAWHLGISAGRPRKETPISLQASSMAQIQLEHEPKEKTQGTLALQRAQSLQTRCWEGMVTAITLLWATHMDLLSLQRC